MSEYVDKDKTVFVNKKLYDITIKTLGYAPSNLVVNPYIEGNKAIVVDNKTLAEGLVK